tara:strand:- start:55 stop:540 length:486 start_codon:yes stop_codon:yes gene_type:complete
MNFTQTGFMTYDDYMTPKYAWENIKEYIPHHKVIWEAFYGDGTSGTHLQDLGFNTIHEPINFFDNNTTPEYDLIVSNPAFSIIKDVLIRLNELDKPFILIMPSSKINTQYFRQWKDKIQIIIPRKRIQFIKNGDELQNSCNFDCFYYCYKMNLPTDIVWLE